MLECDKVPRIMPPSWIGTGHLISHPGPERRRSAAPPSASRTEHRAQNAPQRSLAQELDQAAGLPEGWTLELRTLQAARPFAAEWRDLMGRAVEPNVFASPEVMISAAQHLPAAAPPLALFIRSPRRLVAVIAVRARGWSVLPRAAELFATPFHPVGVPLVDRHHFAPVMRAVMSWIQQPARRGTGAYYGSSPIPGLMLPRISLEGPFFRALSELAREGEIGLDLLDRYSRPVLRAETLAAPSPASPRHRQNLRRLKRRLHDAGPLHVEEAISGPALHDGIETLMALEALGWKGRRGTALAQNTRTASFVGVSSGNLRAGGRIRLHPAVWRRTRGSRAYLGSFGRQYCFKIAMILNLHASRPESSWPRPLASCCSASPASSARIPLPTMRPASWTASGRTAWRWRIIILRPPGPLHVTTRTMIAQQHLSRSIRGTARDVFQRLLRR